MKAIVLSEEQCTWSLEGETFLCLLYCFKTWQFQTTNECHNQHLHYLCTMQIFNVANWRGFFPEISLCCFLPPLTSSLNGCHFQTIVFLWFCSNDHKIGLSVLYTCFHLQVRKSCQILSRPRLGLYILYLLDPDCNYRVIPQL